MDKPLLSICIPAYERPDILKKTLKSIMAQETNDEYEVCISDNSSTNDVEEMIANFSQTNLVYKHIKPVGSYMNLIRALEMGSGQYLKLINDYTMLREGAVQRILDEIKKNDIRDTVISWTNGESTNYCGNNLNFFLKKLSVNMTWTLCFGIWRECFYDCCEKIEMNEMFPHVSVLFENCKCTNRYKIVNEKLFLNQKLEKKGGYNIPDVFGRQYVDMLEKLYMEDIIDNGTLIYLKKKTLQFIGRWKALCISDPKRYTYDYKNDKETIKKVFGARATREYNVAFCISFMKEIIKKTIRRQ